MSGSQSTSPRSTGGTEALPRCTFAGRRSGSQVAAARTTSSSTPDGGDPRLVLHPAGGPERRGGLDEPLHRRRRKSRFRMEARLFAAVDPLLTMERPGQLVAASSNELGLFLRFARLVGLPLIAIGCPRWAP
jgi:hypothetical protein